MAHKRKDTDDAQALLGLGVLAVGLGWAPATRDFIAARLPLFLLLAAALLTLLVLVIRRKLAERRLRAAD